MARFIKLGCDYINADHIVAIERKKGDGKVFSVISTSSGVLLPCTLTPEQVYARIVTGQEYYDQFENAGV